MAQAEPVPLIHVERPSDDEMGLRVLDDATPSINPYFAIYSDANVRGLFSSLYPGHVRPLVSIDSDTRLDASSEYGKGLSHQPYTELYGDASSVPAPNNNFPYPYDFVAHGEPRSPTEAEGSPFTAGSSDAFEGLHSPYFPYGSPFLSSGDPSYTSSSPSLSPLTRDLRNVFLEAEDAPLEQPSIFRTRSYSATEATVAPSDTWRDPCVRPRSASYSIPSLTTGPCDNEPFGYPLELDAIDLDDGFSETGSHYGERGLTSFSNDGFLTSRNASPAPPSVPTTELNSSTLFAPADDHLTITDIMHPKPRHPNPRQPVALSLDTDLNSRTKTSGRSHYRSRSDSSCLSADSPVDRRNNGLIHRSSLSSPESRRHSPYPSAYSSPVSASSESQLSPYLSSQEFAALGITDPSSSGGQGLHRRSTLSATRSPTLKVDSAQLHRVSSDPSSTRYGPQKRRNGKPHSSPGSSVFFISGGSFSTTTGATSRMVSPSESVLSDADLPSPDNYKPIVASQRIVQASNSRRTREARFRCEYEGCLSTFTAKHNLRNHMLSHNGVKPYPCSTCGEKFTTQGVRQRHLTKCAPETAKADRRRRKQLLR